MKKIYIQPNTVTVRVEQQRPVAYSPIVTINKSSVDFTPSEFQVKKNYTDYNVWDDDWSN